MKFQNRQNSVTVRQQQKRNRNTATWSIQSTVRSFSRPEAKHRAKLNLDSDFSLPQTKAQGNALGHSEHSTICLGHISLFL